MQNRIIMIHEIDDNIIKILKEKSTSTDIFTFDDGLYSNYKYLPELLKFPNTKIFFISTGIIRPEILQPNKQFIKCGDAHRLLGNGISGLSNYMSILELQEIDTKTNCFIGVHGHHHIRIQGKVLPKKLYKFQKEIPISNKKELVQILKKDIDNMFFNYYKIFNKWSQYFCFPYNIENHVYKSLILDYIPSFLDTNQTSIKIYGKGRINVNEL